MVVGKQKKASASSRLLNVTGLSQLWGAQFDIRLSKREDWFFVAVAVAIAVDGEMVVDRSETANVDRERKIEQDEEKRGPLSVLLNYI